MFHTKCVNLETHRDLKETGYKKWLEANPSPLRLALTDYVGNYYRSLLIHEGNAFFFATN